MGPSAADPDEAQRAQEIEAEAAKAAEVLAQVDAFLAKCLAVRPDNDAISKAASSSTDGASPVIQDIHSAAESAAKLEGDLSRAIEIYRKRRRAAACKGVRPLSTRAPTIVFQTVDRAFHTEPNSNQPSSPASPPSRVRHHMPPRSPKTRSHPTMPTRQRSVQYNDLVSYMYDREVTTGVDSRRNSVDTSVRRDSSCLMDLSRQSTMDAISSNVDVEGVAHKAESVQSEFDSFIARHRRVLAENRRLRALVDARGGENALEVLVSLSNTAQELRVQFDVLTARHRRLRDRAADLEAKLVQMSYSFHAPSVVLTECNSFRDENLVLNHTTWALDRSATPNETLAEAQQETSDHEEKLAALRIEHEHATAAWMDEKQELLMRIEELSKKVGTPAEPPIAAPVASVRKGAAIKLANEEVAIRSAIEKDQLRGMRLLQHPFEIEKRRLARHAAAAGRTRPMANSSPKPSTRSPTFNIPLSTSAVRGTSPGIRTPAAPGIGKLIGSRSPTSQSRPFVTTAPPSASPKRSLARPNSMHLSASPTHSARSNMSNTSTSASPTSNHSPQPRHPPRRPSHNPGGGKPVRQHRNSCTSP